MKQQITQAEVQKAIEAFKAHGGLTKKLPEEKTPVLNMVGRKWGQYEELFVSDFSSPEWY